MGHAADNAIKLSSAQIVGEFEMTEMQVDDQQAEPIDMDFRKLCDPPSRGSSGSTKRSDQTIG